MRHANDHGRDRPHAAKTTVVEIDQMQQITFVVEIDEMRQITTVVEIDQMQRIVDSIASAFLSGTCRMNLCRCRVVKIECQKLRVVAPCDDDYVGLEADSWSRCSVVEIGQMQCSVVEIGQMQQGTTVPEITSCCAMC